MPLEPISSKMAEDNPTKEASPATATRQGGIAPAQKNCPRIPDFARARFFLPKRKSQFFWAGLHFGAEWRGCLLFTLVQSVKSPPELENIRYSFSRYLGYLIIIIIINMRHDT